MQFYVGNLYFIKYISYKPQGMNKNDCKIVEKGHHLRNVSHIPHLNSFTSNQH